ncbi:MAG: hypothetical protein KDD33_01870 [Bdellovibrionales bacterium]|nr:hypothetical protein [Bdellovibrionales bacterium]
MRIITFSLLAIVLLASYSNCGQLTSEGALSHPSSDNDFQTYQDSDILLTEFAEKSAGSNLDASVQSASVSAPLATSSSLCNIQIGKKVLTCFDIRVGAPSGGNDQPQLQAAIDLAKSKTQSDPNIIARIILNAGKTYHLKRNNRSWSQLKFINAKRIRLIGNNSKFITSFYNRPFYFHNSYNIKISGLSLELDSPLYTSGEIVGKYKKNNLYWIKVRIDASQRMVPGAGVNFSRQLLAKNFLRPTWEQATLWQKNKKLSAGVPSGLFLIKTVNVLNPKQRLIALAIENESKAKAQARYNEILTGEQLVFYLPRVKKSWEENLAQYINREDEFPEDSIGDKNPMIYLNHCGNVVFENISIHDTFKFAVLNENNIGPITFNEFHIKRLKDRWISSMSDGIHSVDGRAPVNISNSTFEALADDSINLASSVLGITKIYKNRKTIEIKSTSSNKHIGMQTGDTLEFFDSLEGDDWGRYIIDEVEKIVLRNSQNHYQGHYYKVTLQTPLPLSVVKHLRTFPDSEQKHTFIFNLSNVHRNSLIANNLFKHKPRHVAIFRGPTTFAGNIAYDVATGIRLANATEFMEGPVPWGAKIYGNRFFNIRGNSIYSRTFTFDMTSDPEAKVENVLVQCNSMHSLFQPPFSFKNLSKASVRNNQKVQNSKIKKSAYRYYQQKNGPRNITECMQKYGKHINKSMP